MSTFVRLVYGQGGKSAWSQGLIAFGLRLKMLGYDVHDDIEWHQPGAIAKDFDTRQAHRKAMIGYSLGANCVTWVSNKLTSYIDLAVAYDPSWGVPMLMPAPIENVSRKIRRCLHYRGLGIPVGGALIEGPTVETTTTWIPHVWVDRSEKLHRMTLQALKELDG